MESITTTDYVVHFNKTAFAALNDHLANSTYSKVFVLVDENTRTLCLPLLQKRLSNSFAFELIEIKSGEENKNISTCNDVWLALSELDADRRSLIINLGGGVVTDLGGFVASTYKRGINFINIPTTLLSMVDASVGGKTGVDLGPLKNQIGVINQPEMVLVVSEFLNTLEDRQMKSGFAEMLKHGLIQNIDYWEELKGLENFEDIDGHIYKSVSIKNKVVIEDPTEKHLRKILNYGHTLGHAVESYFLENKDKETLLHGEAIAVGMILEAFLAHKLTGLAKNELEDIKSTFLDRYKKVNFTDRDIETILSLLKFDKKNSHGHINFVLLEAIGTPIIDVKIPNELYVQAFAYYKK
ncbi:3-dehydroquinate synthase [Maribacter sp. HTCC2170]|uniref:3-dehydroquinate synthase n=1 Tax=Maribacter sp. (strain HTCC2170 / KCCM 42371) TaxID=313603 RepID=UPI00006AFC77|nr:3-dehydroquinate synthase [Maribacter sp. HTCC2170]EAR01207.1 3-dehydroquinate synthase [Maribacter sp. HTCC2170]